MTTRRGFLGALAAAGASTVAGATGADAAEKREAPADAVGMLYDTTLCIGCKTCVVACHEANDLPPDTRNSEDGLHDAPIDVNDQTKNIIKLYKDGDRMSFMKKQCMHCVDPGCVGACMIGAFQKREYGIVTWDGDRCVGCRYCGIACAYEIPRFEWASRNPQIIKCELCNHRINEGGIPACCEVCPRGAVIYGTREELLAEAHRRLEAQPGRYVPKVYGESDGGGTQVLYLSHVPFEKLGLPDLGEEATPSLNRQVQHGVYQGFVAPAALYVALGAVMFRNRRASKSSDAGEGGDA